MKMKIQMYIIYKSKSDTAKKKKQQQKNRVGAIVSKPTDVRSDHGFFFNFFFFNNLYHDRGIWCGGDDGTRTLQQIVYVHRYTLAALLYLHNNNIKLTTYPFVYDFYLN